MPRKGNYKVTIEQSSLDFIAKQTKKVQRQIAGKINTLATNPRSQGCKKLQGLQGLYRIRSGTYRILYTINDRKISVYVVAVDDRKSIYKKLK